MEQQKQLTGQGTRLSETNPWDSYAAEMETKMSPEMAAAVAEYSERRYDDSISSTETKEELCRQQEINGDVAKEYQWLNPEEYEDIEQRTGRVMHSAVFISKLREAGVECWYRDHPQPQKAVLIVARSHGTQPREVGCWVQLGYMPELSIMRFDEHGVPLDERRRGWRTCLLQLILKGIISEEKAVETFGKPGQSRAFDRYNNTLQQFRNAGNRMPE